MGAIAFSLSRSHSPEGIRSESERGDESGDEGVHRGIQPEVEVQKHIPSPPTIPSSPVPRFGSILSASECSVDQQISSALIINDKIELQVHLFNQATVRSISGTNERIGLERIDAGVKAPHFLGPLRPPEVNKLPFDFQQELPYFDTSYMNDPSKKRRIG